MTIGDELREHLRIADEHAALALSKLNDLAMERRHIPDRLASVHGKLIPVCTLLRECVEDVGPAPE